VLDGYFGPVVTRTLVEAERRLARLTDVIVAVSPEIRDELLDFRIGSPERYAVIPLGLDLDDFLDVTRPSGRLRAALGLAATVPLVGAVGRLVAIKGNGTLLEAVASLPDVHLALVGDGDERPALEVLAERLGIAARVHFTGWWDDVPAAMSDLDVVALTSRNEGTPASIIEALAAQRPVVATDVGGVRSVVEHGVTGLLVPSGNHSAVARALGALLADPGVGAGMARTGRDRVRERFGIGRLLGDMRTLYDELLGARIVARR
jgi:glycosyltransferase involved in cell wall biosynthesis